MPSEHKTPGIPAEQFFSALLGYEQRVESGENTRATNRPLIYLLVDARHESFLNGTAELTAVIEAAIRCWVAWRDRIYETLDDGIWAEDFGPWKKEMFPWL